MAKNTFLCIVNVIVQIIKLAKMKQILLPINFEQGLIVDARSRQVLAVYNKQTEKIYLKDPWKYRDLDSEAIVRLEGYEIIEGIIDLLEIHMFTN